MCGRATLVTPPEIIAELFGLDEVPELEPRFNIAPSQTIAIVRRDPERPGRRLELAEWGITGGASRAPSRVVNVRVESMFTRATFREAAAARRCLVVVDGFYEWRGSGKTKQAFHVRRRDARPFALGGLWNGRDGGPFEASAGGDARSPVVTCAILTTTPTPPVDALHDRMPLTIPAESYDAWLDGARCTREDVMELARPAPAGELIAVAVGSFVNDPAREGPHCLRPEAQTELL